MQGGGGVSGILRIPKGYPNSYPFVFKHTFAGLRLGLGPARQSANVNFAVVVVNAVGVCR